MNIKRKLLVCLLGTLPFMHLFGQRTIERNFKCGDCEDENISAAITYGGDSYNEGDIIFINDFHNGQIVEQSQNSPYQIGLDIPCDVAATWTVTAAGTDVTNQITSKNLGKTLALTFQKDHYELLNVTASYLGKSISVEVLPINFVVDIPLINEIRTNDDGIPIIQSDEEESLKFGLNNNEDDFMLSRGLTIEIMQLNEDVFSLIDGSTNTNCFFWSHENGTHCGLQTLEFRLKAPSGEELGRLQRQVQVQCTFELEDLIAKSLVQNRQDNEPEFREAHAGDKLYLIRAGNNNVRNIDYELVTNVSNEDFWDNSPSPLDDEPIWTAGNQSPIGTGMKNYSFPHNNFPSFPGDETALETKVAAFDMEQTVDLIFLREDREIVDGPIQIKFLETLGDLISGFSERCKSVNKKTKELFGIEYNCPEFSISTSFETYNREDPFSPKYINAREIKTTGKYSWNFTRNLVPITNIIPNNLGTAKVNLFADIGIDATINSVEEKKFDEENFKHARNEFEIGGNGELGGEVILEFLPDVKNLGFTAIGQGLSKISVRREVIDNPQTIVNVVEWDPFLIRLEGQAELGITLFDISWEQNFFDRIIWMPSISVLD